MIRELVLKNFQAHGKLVLKLDPHVTTIVGPTDVGKSAIIRALRWVSLNRPRGTDFRKHGADRVSVTLRTSQHEVTRIRGKKRNSYRLDGRNYNAFGNDVPEAVSSALALSDLNFQRQIDPPFWFTESAPEVSRRLNQVVDLSLIDSTLSKLSSQDRAARSELKVSHERLERAETELATLSRAKEVDSHLRKLERAEQRLGFEEARVRYCSDLLDAVREAQEVVDRLSGDLGACQLGLGVLEERARRLEKGEERLEGLQQLVDEAYSSQEALHALEDVLEEHEQLFHEELGKTCPLCGGSPK